VNTASQVQQSTPGTTNPGGEATALFAAGDYFAKNGRLYFFLDYIIGGYIIENCETLCTFPVEFDFFDSEVKWIAKDLSYRRSVPIQKPAKERG
jgi:hypothetical protein